MGQDLTGVTDGEVGPENSLQAQMMLRSSTFSPK